MLLRELFRVSGIALAVSLFGLASWFAAQYEPKFFRGMDPNVMHHEVEIVIGMIVDFGPYVLPFIALWFVYYQLMSWVPSGYSAYFARGGKSKVVHGPSYAFRGLYRYPVFARTASLKQSTTFTVTTQDQRQVELSCVANAVVDADNVQAFAKGLEKYSAPAEATPSMFGGQNTAEEHFVRSSANQAIKSALTNAAVAFQSSELLEKVKLAKTAEDCTTKANEELNESAIRISDLNVVSVKFIN
jgi:hypothetical protein